MEEARRKETPVKWVAVGILIGVFVVFALGYFMDFFFVTRKELTIASFEKEVPDDISPYLSLYIEDYGVTDETIWCKGSVTYIGPEGKYASGFSVFMGIMRAGANSVNIKVMLYGGGLILPKGKYISYDCVDVPDLGAESSPYPNSFEFSLSCTYE